MYKTILQEVCQKRRWSLPEYSTTRDGPYNNSSFTATVTVNGAAFSTPQPSRSIKEAQNFAANIAYMALMAENQQSAAVGEFPPQPQGANLVNAANEEHAGGEVTGQTDDPIPQGLQQMYKNKLQQYSQKNNIAFPVYKNEFDGPPHVRIFRSTVYVGGKEYESDGFFPTVKDAEQSAAQKACHDLPVDSNQEDASFYKNLLQQMTQKRGNLFPTYVTASSGPPHNMLFACTVEVEGYTFKGPEAKSKKQAEAMAAKVAYLAFTKAASTQSTDHSATEGPPIAAAADTSRHVHLTPPAANGLVKTNEAKEAENQQEEPSPAITQTTAMAVSIQLPDANPALSLSNSGYYQLQSPTDARPVEVIPNGENSKTLIVRRGSNYQIPPGAVVKNCSDEWIAYEIMG